MKRVAARPRLRLMTNPPVILSRFDPTETTSNEKRSFVYAPPTAPAKSAESSTMQQAASKTKGSLTDFFTRRDGPAPQPAYAEGAGTSNKSAASRKRVATSRSRPSSKRQRLVGSDEEEDSKGIDLFAADSDDDDEDDDASDLEGFIVPDDAPIS